MAYLLEESDGAIKGAPLDNKGIGEQFPKVLER
jgi:hypothetical protein